MEKPLLKAVNNDVASNYCFGAMQFGDGADAAESQKMYAACREKGINFFDTAFGYTEGRSEQILGSLVAAERDQIIVATKCSGIGDSSPKVIREQLDESLRRLDMDMVDILYLHKFDDDTPLEDSFGELAKQQKAGKFRYVGVSNFAAWQTVKAQQIARDLGTNIDILQPMYNLVKRQVEVEILPMAISEGLNVAPYSPLGGGLLTGKYAKGGQGRIASNAMYAKRYDVEWMRKTAIDLSELAATRDVHPATLAVAWVAKHTGITQPIISARSLAQLGPSLDAIGFEMSDALYREISDLSQTPAPATDRLEEMG